MALEQLCRVDIHYPIPLTPSLPPPWYPAPKTSSAKTLHPTLLLSQIHFVFWLRLAFYIKLRINDTREASEDAHTIQHRRHSEEKAGVSLPFGAH